MRRFSPILALAILFGVVAQSAHAGPVGGAFGPGCGATETHGFRDGKAWINASVTNSACRVNPRVEYRRSGYAANLWWVDTSQGNWFPRGGVTSRYRVLATYGSPEWCVSIYIPAWQQSRDWCTAFGGIL